MMACAACRWTSSKPISAPSWRASATRERLALLAGMRVPAKFGADYAAAFHAVYARLAARHRVPLYPFFLEGVAMVPDLNQADGIHPNAAGVAEIVRRIVPHVVALVVRHKGG